MGKLIVTEFISLDGVIENPSWSGQYWNDAITKIKTTEYTADKAWLMGGVTYDIHASSWPTSTEESAKMMNNMKKYVVSTTADASRWNNTERIDKDVVQKVESIKAESDVIVDGSSELLKTLMENNLVDEYHLLLFPIVVGGGKRLFKDGETASLEVAECTNLGNGVVYLVYTPTVTTQKV
jgi:dihydrofolate reductase